eukprot:4994335-Amphidinium_carterae.1
MASCAWPLPALGQYAQFPAPCSNAAGDALCGTSTSEHVLGTLARRGLSLYGQHPRSCFVLCNFQSAVLLWFQSYLYMARPHYAYNT